MAGRGRYNNPNPELPGIHQSSFHQKGETGGENTKCGLKIRFQSGARSFFVEINVTVKQLDLFLKSDFKEYLDVDLRNQQAYIMPQYSPNHIVVYVDQTLPADAEDLAAEILANIKKSFLQVYKEFETQSNISSTLGDSGQMENEFLKSFAEKLKISKQVLTYTLQHGYLMCTTTPDKIDPIKLFAEQLSEKIRHGRDINSVGITTEKELEEKMTTVGMTTEKELEEKMLANMSQKQDRHCLLTIKYHSLFTDNKEVVLKNKIVDMSPMLLQGILESPVLKTKFEDDIKDFGCYLDTTSFLDKKVVLATTIRITEPFINGIVDIFNKLAESYQICSVSNSTLEFLQERKYHFTLLPGDPECKIILYNRKDVIHWPLTLDCHSIHKEKSGTDLSSNAITINGAGGGLGNVTGDPSELKTVTKHGSPEPLSKGTTSHSCSDSAKTELKSNPSNSSNSISLSLHGHDCDGSKDNRTQVLTDTEQSPVTSSDSRKIEHGVVLKSTPGNSSDFYTTCSTSPQAQEITKSLCTGHGGQADTIRCKPEIIKLFKKKTKVWTELRELMNAKGAVLNMSDGEIGVTPYEKKHIVAKYIADNYCCHSIDVNKLGIDYRDLLLNLENYKEDVYFKDREDKVLLIGHKGTLERIVTSISCSDAIRPAKLKREYALFFQNKVKVLSEIHTAIIGIDDDTLFLDNEESRKQAEDDFIHYVSKHMTIIKVEIRGDGLAYETRIKSSLEKLKLLDSVVIIVDELCLFVVGKKSAVLTMIEEESSVKGAKIFRFFSCSLSRNQQVITLIKEDDSCLGDFNIVTKIEDDILKIGGCDNEVQNSIAKLKKIMASVKDYVVVRNEDKKSTSLNYKEGRDSNVAKHKHGETKQSQTTRSTSTSDHKEGGDSDAAKPKHGVSKGSQTARSTSTSHLKEGGDSYVGKPKHGGSKRSQTTRSTSTSVDHRDTNCSFTLTLTSPSDCLYICQSSFNRKSELERCFNFSLDLKPTVIGTKDLMFASYHFKKGSQMKFIVGETIRPYDEDGVILVLCNRPNIDIKLFDGDDTLFEMFDQHSKTANDNFLEIIKKEGKPSIAFIRNFQHPDFKKKPSKLEAEFKRLMKDHACKSVTLLFDYHLKDESNIMQFILKKLADGTEPFKHLEKTVLIPKVCTLSCVKSDIERFLKPELIDFEAEGHCIEIVPGRIEEQMVDVIVNSTGENFKLSQGVISNSILEVTGPEIQGEIQNRYNKQSILNKRMAVTTGGKSSYKCIVHVCLPAFNPQIKEPLKNMGRAIWNSLEEANRREMSSIAFPALGIGNLEYPVDLVARCMLDEINGYFRILKRKYLCHVMIVAYDETNRQAFYHENLQRVRMYNIGGDLVQKVEITIKADKKNEQEIKECLKEQIKSRQLYNTCEDSSENLENPSDSRSAATEDGEMVVRNQNRPRNLQHHEERCVIVTAHGTGTQFAGIRNLLAPEFSKKGIDPMCFITPFEVNHNRAFIAFKSSEDKVAACSTEKLKEYKMTPETPKAIINDFSCHVSIPANISVKELKMELEKASGVFVEFIDQNEIYIEGCEIQIHLAETMLQERLENKSKQTSSGEYHGGARPKVPTNSSSECKRHNLNKSVFKAVHQIIGKETVQKVSHFAEQPDGSVDFYLLKSTTDEAVLKIKDLIEDIRHEEVKIPEDKMDEACEFSEDHDYKESVYVGVDDDTSTVHILGVDFNEVEEIVHKFKIAVGLLKITNKKLQRTRDDSFSSLPPQTELQEKTFNTSSKNIKVIVKKSDITKLNVDVIVNAANGYMAHGGGVANHISKAGGYRLNQECQDYIKRYGQIPVSGICKTTGGDMACNKVYHAVGPRWDDYPDNKKDCEDDLCKTIIRCLVEADKDGYKSIAIPSISSAIFRVPKSICVEMYVRAVNSFDNLHNVINLSEIYFVDIQKDMVSSVQGGFEMFLNKSLDDLQKQTLGRLINDIAGGTRYGDMDSTTSSQIKSSKPGRSGVAQSQESQLKMVIKKQESKTYMICSLNPDFSIHIYQSDAITSSKTAAITTWEDTHLSNFNANTKIIIKEAGQKYEDERTEIKTNTENKFKAGSVITTSAGSLPFKYIFHLVSSIKPKEEELESLISNLLEETGKTSVHSVTTGNGNVDVSVLFDVLLKQLQKNIEMQISSTLKEIHLVVKSEENMTEFHKLHQDLVHQEDDKVRKDEECIICMEVISNRKNLPCGHSFCGLCIDQAMKLSIFCPICRQNVYGGIQTGTQPEGEMKVTTHKYSLPGYDRYGTIEINYIFRDGIQSEKHPNPGKPFKGTTRTAYLPDNRDGQEVLSLLKTAWERRLIFTVGKSVTTGQNDVVTWNDIHHKTSTHGGPNSFGYPDSGYLKRVKGELMAHGVTSEKPR